jgi:hypothetical protein
LGTPRCTADSDNGGQSEAFKATAAVAGSVKSLRVFVDAGSSATAS